MTEPIEVHYFYRTRWGCHDEFVELFRKNHWPILREQWAAGRYVNVELFTPRFHGGGGADWDEHPGCEHIYYVLSGRAHMCVEDEEFDLEPGDCLLMREGARHKVDVTGSETFRIAVVFAPGRV